MQVMKPEKSRTDLIIGSRHIVVEAIEGKKDHHVQSKLTNIF
ncbi:MAG: hypothetical protein PV340_01860 [Wolbachia sp.]|nr:hypothetical protein [Wolbachia sp.]MDD9336738.1 hypothetical protein [Wolbachia sp.]